MNNFLKKHNKIIIFLSITILLISVSFYLAFLINNKKRKERGDKELTFIRFINNDSKITLRSVGVGMSFGIIFGFIDNFGLWYGMDYLDPYLPGGNLTKAGFGNTFSDFIGATLGTSISIILSNLIKTEQSPIWLDSIGIVIGCLIGLVVPRYLSGKT